MNQTILFGPSGADIAFNENPAYRGTVDMPLYVKGLGLDCFEYSFGKGVRMSEATATAIAQRFREEGIAISVHAPYFINLANPDPEKRDNSIEYLVQSLRALRLLGGERCVFHPGSALKRPRGEAFAEIERNMHRLSEVLHELALDDMLVCPETMGKINQMGTVDEVARLCTIDPMFIPCVDWGHINAREHGSLQTKDDFKRVVDTFSAVLPWEKVSHMHIHFSKIMYSEGGEVKHLTMQDTQYGPCFEPLAEVLREYDMKPYIVSESDGTQGADAVLMRDIYLRCDH